MIIEKEKTPQAIPFNEVLPGEVFCYESDHNATYYFIKLKETVYTSSCDDYEEEYDAVNLATGTPIRIYYTEKCIVKPNAKLIFTN